MYAVGEHHQVKADQTHVMGQWHPRQADVVWTEVRDLGGAAHIRHQVGMRERHALGLAGGAGRKLNEGQIPGRGAIGLAAASQLGKIIGEKFSRPRWGEPLKGGSR